MKKFFKDFIEPIIIAIVLSVLIINFVLYKVHVDGSSMYPNLENGQEGMSFVISKYIGIDRFEIAIVDIGDKEIVKRIIGLPNETIEYKDDTLYVDGELIEQEYDFIKNSTPDFKITLNDDEYFVLGDNRPVSRDSRDIGPIKKSQIKSLHVLVLTPFKDFGFRK